MIRHHEVDDSAPIGTRRLFTPEHDTLSGPT
jgi:hypothetical protein